MSATASAIAAVASTPTSARKEPKKAESLPVESRSGTFRSAGIASVQSPSATKKVVLRDVGFFDLGSTGRPKSLSITSEDVQDISPKLGKCNSSPLAGSALPKTPAASKGVLKPSSAPAREAHSKLDCKSPSSSPKSPKKVSAFALPKNEADGSPTRRRRHSVPCLKRATLVVDTTKPEERPSSGASGSGDTPNATVVRRGKRLISRRVSFGDGQELFEAFTPYGKKYGAHPDDFFFDAKGHMVLTTSAETDADVLEVKADDILECLREDGVDYYTRPQLSARLSKRKTVGLGEQVVVKKRCGEWIQDSVGWLPLLVGTKRAFEVVVPKEKLRYATARVPVMAPSENPISP